MEDKSTVYLETTIAGYLTGRSSNDLVLAGKQEVTRQWWDYQRGGFRLVTSRFTVEEAARGDAAASARRLVILEECELLLIDSDVLELAQAIVATGVIPQKAIIDASHIATAARHGIDFLLTWNCAHIANARILRHIEQVIAKCGYRLPVICTPDELFEIPEP